MAAIDVRKWRATTHGLRSVSTLIPPMTACTGMIGEGERGEGNLPALHDRRAMSVASAMAPSTNVSCRLVNSIRP